MTLSPRLIKGGIVQVDPQSLAVRTVVALQYNPDSVSRTLQPSTDDGRDRGQAVRFKGPPLETIRLEAEIDATDQLDRNDRTAAQYGIAPQLARLETLVSPPVAQLRTARELADQGELEIVPPEAPLTLWVWSKSRIVPVRLTELSLAEEAFDERLNPIRVRVTLAMRVLALDDLGVDHPGSGLFLRYQQFKEDLAGRAPRADFSQLGIGGIQ